MTTQEIRTLPIDEKIRIMAAIWEDMRDHHEEAPISQDVIDLLKERQSRVNPNQMIPIFNPHNPGSEFFTEELCHITELSNSPNDPEQSIARARVEPGITTRWHALIDTTERYVVISGQGIVEIGDLPPAAMSPLDVATIPPGTRQRITNTGTTDLIFLALCTPRFRPECYQDLDSKGPT